MMLVSHTQSLKLWVAASISPVVRVSRAVERQVFNGPHSFVQDRRGATIGVEEASG